MKYTKYTFTLAPDTQDFRDVLMAMAGEIGFESFVENEESVDAFIPTASDSSDLMERLMVESMFSFSFTTEEIPDQNWNEEWEKNYFKPLVVSDKCVVRAPFHTEFPQADYEIIIEPNMAFGTGNHETTTMMMEFILESNLQQMEVLDMGCGTGILAILASMRGAKSVTAIDIDEWSYRGTIENSQLNNILNIKPLLGDYTVIPLVKFDVILANIHKNIIISDLPVYAKALKPEGAIIVSGFYASDLDDVIRRAADLGLALVSSKTKNNWCSACFAFSLCRGNKC